MIKQNSPAAEAFAEIMEQAAATKSPPEPEALAYLGEILFRKYDDEAVTAAVIREFLSLKWYGAITAIIAKSLLNRNYGAANNKYLGVKYQYTAEERYFDRFIEMTRAFEIAESELLPLLVFSQSPYAVCGAEKWSRPADEYLSGMCAKDFKGTLAAVCVLSGCAGALENLAKINEAAVTEAAAPALFENSDADKQELTAYFSRRKRPAVAYAAQYINDERIAARENAARVLILFKQDEEVRKLLLAARKKEKTRRIRALIDAACGAELYARGFTSIGELEAVARASKLRGATRQFLVVLYDKNGNKLSRAACSYILGVLGNKNIPALQKAALYSIKPLLDEKKLISECARLTAAQIFPAYFFVFLLGCEDCAAEILKKTDLSAMLPAIRRQFLLACGISRLKICRGYLKKIADGNKYTSAVREALAVITAVTGRTYEDIREEFQNDFNLDNEGKYTHNKESGAHFSRSLEVGFYGVPNMRVGAWAKKLLSAVELWAKRFENSFIASRRWKPDLFRENILGNNFLKILASTLFFGEYDKDNKFIRLISPDDFSSVRGAIGLIHPLELDKNTRYLTTVLSRQLFNQMRRETYSLKDYELSYNCVSRFKGNLLFVEKFSANLKSAGFTREKGAAYKIINDCLIKIEYSEKLIAGSLNISVGEIRFYPASSTPKLKGKYIADKSYALSLRSLPPQLISDVIYEMTKIVKQ
jgi:hypothetical protein